MRNWLAVARGEELKFLDLWLFYLQLFILLLLLCSDWVYCNSVGAPWAVEGHSKNKNQPLYLCMCAMVFTAFFITGRSLGAPQRCDPFWGGLRVKEAPFVVGVVHLKSLISIVLAFKILRVVIRGEAVQLHTKVYTFSFENIFCACLPHTHTKAKFVFLSLVSQWVELCIFSLWIPVQK